MCEDDGFVNWTTTSPTQIVALPATHTGSYVLLNWVNGQWGRTEVGTLGGYTWRDAMAGMANVMTGVYQACYVRPVELGQLEARQRETVWLHREQFDSETQTRISREWSAEVRRKVAALPPLGPVIACQGDWIDD